MVTVISSPFDSKATFRCSVIRRIYAPTAEQNVMTDRIRVRKADDTLQGPFALLSIYRSVQNKPYVYRYAGIKTDKQLSCSRETELQGEAVLAWKTTKTSLFNYFDPLT